MRILFKSALVPGFSSTVNVVVKDKLIEYVGNGSPSGDFDRTVDCSARLLLPGFYNCHTHSAMTLFRGYGEDMTLSSWLNDRIFPAEERLTSRAVYIASKLAIAEMIRGGTVSFSDMYFFCSDTARAVEETGIKANISRSLVSFDPDIDPSGDERFAEAKALFEQWHGAADGRIRIDMSLHAEYTNVRKYCEAVADYTASVGAGLHIHLSETKDEHEQCKARNGGLTPAGFFDASGCFDVPVTAAHCVWVDDNDIALMARKGVTAVHNPCSNLKLGSGVMPLHDMLCAGVNVALGTDSAASNNSLDIRGEMYLASLLAKGLSGDPTRAAASTMLTLISENGAKTQGRELCGKLEAGYRADIVLIDMDALNNIPFYDPTYAAVYSASADNVCMTMVDGRILYENGEFTTIDIEKLREEMRDVCKHYFD